MQSQQTTTKIWRDPFANESQVRHIHSIQHHPLMFNTPTSISSNDTLKAKRSPIPTIPRSSSSTPTNIGSNIFPLPLPGQQSNYNSILSSLSMSLLLPPPLYASELWNKQEEYHRNQIREHQEPFNYIRINRLLKSSLTKKDKFQGEYYLILKCIQFV